MTKRETTPPTPSCHLYASPLPCFVILEGFTVKDNDPQRAKNNHTFFNLLLPPFLVILFHSNPLKNVIWSFSMTPHTPYVICISSLSDKFWKLKISI